MKTILCAFVLGFSMNLSFAEEMAKPHEIKSESKSYELKGDLEKIYFGCCRTCTVGCACGDSCISCSKNCTKGSGCACNG